MTRPTSKKLRAVARTMGSAVTLLAGGAVVLVVWLRQRAAIGPVSGDLHWSGVIDRLGPLWLARQVTDDGLKSYIGLIGIERFCAEELTWLAVAATLSLCLWSLNSSVWGSLRARGAVFRVASSLGPIAGLVDWFANGLLLRMSVFRGPIPSPMPSLPM